MTYVIKETIIQLDSIIQTSLFCVKTGIAGSNGSVSELSYLSRRYIEDLIFQVTRLHQEQRVDTISCFLLLYTLTSHFLIFNVRYKNVDMCQLRAVNVYLTSISIAIRKIEII